MLPVVWSHCSSHCSPWFSSLLLKCIWRTTHPNCHLLQPPALCDENEQGYWLPAEEVSWQSDDQSTYQQPQQSSGVLFSVVAWGSAEASWGQEANISMWNRNRKEDGSGQLSTAKVSAQSRLFLDIFLPYLITLASEYSMGSGDLYHMSFSQYPQGLQRCVNQTRKEAFPALKTKLRYWLIRKNSQVLAFFHATQASILLSSPE